MTPPIVITWSDAFFLGYELWLWIKIIFGQDFKCRDALRRTQRLSRSDMAAFQRSHSSVVLGPLWVTLFVAHCYLQSKALLLRQSRLKASSMSFHLSKGWWKMPPTLFSISSRYLSSYTAANPRRCESRRKTQAKLLQPTSRLMLMWRFSTRQFTSQL